MATNLDKYKKDLEDLIILGDALLEDLSKNKYKANSFFSNYQRWYSETCEVIKQLLPNRFAEFERLYSGEKRKNITGYTYTIQDWLLGIRAPINKLTGKKWFDDFPAMAMRFQNQLLILKSARSRFESSLFDIQQLVRADLFDSEVDIARELLKNGFSRAAGAVAGVVLEEHLKQVCSNHNVKVKKKNPHISDYNEALKGENVIDIPNWRFIQRLGDLRNLCVHKKDREPVKDEVDELIKGVAKITKTLF